MSAQLLLFHTHSPLLLMKVSGDWIMILHNDVALETEPKVAESIKSVRLSSQYIKLIHTARPKSDI